MGLAARIKRIFFQRRQQHALERWEDLRERRNSGDFLGDCLEEKHGGKDWQHASSSHWKPSNSSQKLVLPDDKFRDSWNERL